MKDVTIAITAASYSGNKGAAAMLQSSIKQLYDIYGAGLRIKLMSVYPEEDKKQLPFEFIDVVSCQPQELLFIVFPAAVLYKLFSWCKPIKKLLQKNKVIKAYTETDLVIDEAGISFVDSRGIVMNTYAFVSVLVPLLTKTPVVKYSQALGEFKNLVNRILAKMILPKMSLICARGEITQENLKSIGITSNVQLCADGAFSMPDDIEIAESVAQLCEQDDFYKGKVIGVSVSSVVEKKCDKLGIDYKQIMSDFSEYLIEQGYKVLIIANAAREGNEKPRNNDLMICNAVYDSIQRKDAVRWYPEEMTAEKIRELISKCDILIASRFHAMIGALYKEVPVLLIGWSHKYKEVLDMFELGSYAADFSKLSLELVIKEFQNVVENKGEIKSRIKENLPKVQESSANNIKLISEVIDNNLNNKGLFDFNNIETYIGKAVDCRMGYGSKAEIRANAASGGMVTSLLCSLLRNGKIDGAWVTKSYIENGELKYKTVVATTEEEIQECSSSIYMEIPLLKHADEILRFNGKLAVVMLPCQLRGLTRKLESNKEYQEKVVLKIGLYCSGEHSENATLMPLRKAKISLENAKKLIYRNGHWRGRTQILYQDGTNQSISYAKTICAYKNAFFFSKRSCLFCQDQYGYDSDISFGDIWLKSMKKNPIKHTSCIIRNNKALELYQSAVENGDIVDFPISRRNILMSQKRALVFKWRCASSKVELYQKQGKKIKLNCTLKSKWNHKLAYKLANYNNKFSIEKTNKLEKVPNFVIYYYMCFIRVLLSF